jgi:hypothetical protein
MPPSTEHPRTTRTATREPSPPRLRLHLLRHLKLLLVLNILPLIGGAYLWWQWREGRVTLRKPIGEESWMALGAVLVAGAGFALACWLVLPFARWLRDRPTWCFTHRNPWLWAAPMAAGWIAWVVLMLAGLATAVLCLVEGGRGLWRLLELAR